ncbi:MAG: hypothetical protein PGN24_08800 [Microbacterium arborescens]
MTSDRSAPTTAAAAAVDEASTREAPSPAPPRRDEGTSAPWVTEVAPSMIFGVHPSRSAENEPPPVEVKSLACPEMLHVYGEVPPVRVSVTTMFVSEPLATKLPPCAVAVPRSAGDEPAKLQPNEPLGPSTCVGTSTTTSFAPAKVRGVNVSNGA